MRWITEAYEDEDGRTSQVTVQFRDIYNARAAMQLRDTIRSMPTPTTIVLDFSRVAKVRCVDLAALIPTLASFHGHQFRSEGLPWRQQLFLERFGVPPVGSRATIPPQALPEA